ncbi:MAG: hypothetical protein ACRC1K_25965 [Planctomycetia bacterium]
MRRSSMLVWASAAVVGCFVGAAGADDEIQSIDDAGKKLVAKGTIREETPKQVTIQTATGAKQIPVNQIVEIDYDKTPPNFTRLLSEYRLGRYQEVAAAAAEMLKTEIDPEKQEYLSYATAFLILQANAELAIQDPSNKAAAEETLKWSQKLVQLAPESRHFYPMNELMGRFYLSTGDNEKAAKAFAVLSDVEFPGYKEKSKVYQGVAALRQNKAKEAVELLDSVIAEAGASPAAKEQKNAAEIYKGEALVALGNAAEAEPLLRKALDEAPAEASYIKAVGRNALGDALMALKKPEKLAMLDGYMWVNVMYDDHPDQLSRALFHLSRIFTTIGQKDRAVQCEARLKTEFPNSEWTKKLGSG